MTEDHEIALGHEAKALMESEAFSTAFANLTKELTDQWANSPTKAEADRERLYLMLWLSKRLRMHLESLMTNGKMAELRKDTIAQRLSRSLPEWMRFNDSESRFV